MTVPISSNAACKISLLHATRGRPQQAVAVRERWLASAAKPERVEHIFAMDCDDVDTIQSLQTYPHRVVPQEGLGCVAAWNLAAQASTGDVLVQLSDDWSPAPGWDDAIAARLRDVSLPGVLRISDGHRTDDLLCMAIFTRSWLRELGDFLHPGYFSVFSDDEFSYLSYDKGVVIDARDIVFTHHHPFLDPTVSEDETYRRQNQSRHYQRGREIFLQRYPQALGRWLHEGTERRQFLAPGHHATLSEMGVTAVAPGGRKADAAHEKWKTFAQRCDDHLRGRKAHAAVFQATAGTAVELLRSASKSWRSRLFWKQTHQARLRASEAKLQEIRQALASGEIRKAIETSLSTSRAAVILIEEFQAAARLGSKISGRMAGALRSEVQAQEKWWQQVTALLETRPDLSETSTRETAVSAGEGRIE